MKNFEKTMNIFMDQMEDLAYELCNDDDIKAYLVEHYGYNEEEDNVVDIVVKYISKYYNV